MENEKEITRIKAVYDKRNLVYSTTYSFFNPAHLFIIQGRDREIINAFKKHGINSLENKKILDIGCGKGKVLRDLIRYGAKPENCYGVDLLEDRIDIAKTISPNIYFISGDASSLSFENDFFDIVLVLTVFSSILDRKMKDAIASEMLRVLKPRGFILWYDFHMNNPKNPDVKGVRKKEIYELFPGCDVYLKRITLAPPITRAIAPYSYMFCYLLEKIKVLNTHYVGIIKKKENT